MHVHFHHHTSMTRSGVGEIRLCYRFGNIIGLWFRPEGFAADWHRLPLDRLDAAKAARNVDDVQRLLADAAT